MKRAEAFQSYLDHRLSAVGSVRYWNVAGVITHAPGTGNWVAEGGSSGTLVVSSGMHDLRQRGEPEPDEERVGDVYALPS